MKPGKAWYLLAVIPLALGVGLSVFFAFGLADEIKTMQRVVVPGEGTFQVAPGDYVAYLENDSIHEGVAYHPLSPPSLRCGVTDESGAEVALESPSATTSYSFGSYAGKSQFAFTAARAGTFELACEGEGGPATVAIGTGVGGEVAGMAISGLGGLALALVVFFLVRRRRRQS